MKNLIYLFLLVPILYSCQKYNKPPYDNLERKLRVLPDTINTIPMDSLWYKRDSLTYLRFKNIKLMYMEVDSIPNWIGSYNNLSFLSTTVSKHKFKVIPKSIGNLKKLTSLTLSNGEISIIPSELYNLISIQYFNIEDNNIKSIDKNINQLKKLKSLSLSDNPITTIPKEICELNNLESLVLENTKIKELPKCLGDLQYLNWINISGTRLEEFPIEILNAPKLETIHAKGLKLKNYKEVKAICKKRNITFYYDE
ncbi:leucine-rich repeat domain-containing protein [Chryseobacterium gallinarum]|uniref:Leucine-rich repeat domain-containing protein n=1 Tax=Chryseobacterium gallinarum TaxID=1324352 RepID=A0ABX6KR33_CHRGL|nr:leucine-rich repeat domain-containing protein [Chryseobacterium gallinarum]QIY91081.1 leucine-rich repeat domain-containing protein [Chryseobacterium gallinarum]